MKEREEERNKKDFDDDKRYGDSDEIEPPRRRPEGKNGNPPVKVSDNRSNLPVNLLKCRSL
jgi:hypothetical protein